MSPVITFGGLLGEATEGRIVNHLPINVHAVLQRLVSHCSRVSLDNTCSSTSWIPFQHIYPLVISLFFPIPQSAIESLFGASLTGIAYSLFAGQPLTILGSTGPVLVFEKILFKFCKYVFFPWQMSNFVLLHCLTWKWMYWPWIDLMDKKHAVLF